MESSPSGAGETPVCFRAKTPGIFREERRDSRFMVFIIEDGVKEIKAWESQKI
jgi:hypothetical protein